jgi:hypothetical protein
MDTEEKLNLEEWVWNPIDAAIPMLNPTEQTVLDAFADYAVDNSPHGVGDVSLMCDISALVMEHAFGEIAPGDLFDAITSLMGDGLFRVDDQMSEMDVVLTAKGWMSWSDWSNDLLFEIATSEAGQGWDWDSLIGSMPPLMAQKVQFCLKTFRRADQPI